MDVLNDSTLDANTVSNKKNVMPEHQPDYEKAETDLLRDALQRTHKERFLMATRLYKIQQMLNNAIVTHQS